ELACMHACKGGSRYDDHVTSSEGMKMGRLSGGCSHQVRSASVAKHRQFELEASAPPRAGLLRYAVSIGISPSAGSGSGHQVGMPRWSSSMWSTKVSTKTEGETCRRRAIASTLRLVSRSISQPARTESTTVPRGRRYGVGS